MYGDRDVGAFDARATRYEGGRLGDFHRQLCDRSLELALRRAPAPRRVLDVGCGTGYLLRRLSARTPPETMLVGVDPSHAMVRVARGTADARIRFAAARAERLPFSDASFDLVVSTTSFDHWHHQGGGLSECRRVMTPGARLVLVDLFSAVLLPTVMGSRRGKARTKKRAQALLETSGFSVGEWHNVFATLIRAVVAVADQ